MIIRLFVILFSLIMISCSGGRENTNIEVIQDMMEQPALKAQDFHPQDREKSSMLVPPKGSWPKNVKPYIYSGQSPEEVGKKLSNPFANENAPEFIERGKRNYNNYCLLCHGPTGQGDGQIAAKFVGIKPPPLVSDKVKNFADGRIFHIITEGRGVMGAHIHQLPDEKDRWAVVNYIRSLQRK